MPNHVKNVITVQSDPDGAKLRQIAEFLRPEGQPLGFVDFNKLIPMPESLNIESSSRGEAELKQYKKHLEQGGAVDDPELFALGKQYYDNIQQYGCPTWYEWANRNWGTKWNAYDCVELTSISDAIMFHTAWAGVPALLEKLSERFPACQIEYRWADEDLGWNLGSQVYKDGAVVSEEPFFGGTPEAVEFSAQMWDVDLAAEGLLHLLDDGAYDYSDHESEQPPKSAKKPVQKKTAKARGKSR